MTPAPAPLHDRCNILDAKALCSFLSEYGAWLLGCGAACIRLEKNISRIAGTYGMTADFVIMPRHIHMTVTDPACSDAVTVIEAVKPTPIDFDLNTRLSRLSWEIADHHLDFLEAVKRFERILESRRGDSWFTVFLVVIANASFCRLFGGDFVAMGVVGIATLIGYLLKLALLSRHIDPRIVFLLCAFTSALIASADTHIGLSTTPAIALGTSVLYLVPGIPFLNSFSDLLYRHYICAFSRFLDAAVMTICLSAGLCGAMLLMHEGMF